MGAEHFRPAGDSADDSIVAAIAERWRILVEDAAAQSGFSFRPALEAAELRRLCRTTSAPADMIARVWRAMAGDMLVARGLKAVYIAGGEPAQSMQGARGYFGFGANMVQVTDIREALDRADDTPGVLACLPWPENAGPGQWWPMLNENRFRELSIGVGWPSLPGSPAEAPRMAVVGRIAVETSGDDDMLATAHDDTFCAERCLAEAGIAGEVAARARSLVLMRIREFVAPDDPRLDRARQAGLDGLRIVGVRPRP
ncbi:MAG: hypothetical protein SGJ21_09785 [Alphaproteobacteria bacterium]|nr:hypothetical protein [Alphaproteobacteria bacterium]